MYESYLAHTVVCFDIYDSGKYGNLMQLILNALEGPHIITWTEHVRRE